MDLLAQSALILSVTAFSLAVTTVARNLRNRLGQGFVALCALVSLWALSFLLSRLVLPDFFYRTHLTFHLLLAPVCLSFVRVFTRVEDHWSRGIWHASLVYSLPLIPLQWSDLGEHDLARILTHLAPVFLTFECIHLMAIDVRLSRGGPGGRLRDIPSTVGMTRKSFIYLGAILVQLSCSMDHLSYHLPWVGDVIPSVGNMILAFYLFMLSAAVTQQRLLNVTALIHRMLVVIFLSLGLTLIYSLLVAWVENSPGLFVLNTFIASFIILMLIEPIQKIASIGVMQLFTGQYLRLEEKVKQFQAQLTETLDPVSLAQLTLQFVDQTLKPEFATVYVLRSNGMTFRRLRGLRDEETAPREVSASHPVIAFFLRMKERGETPVILESYLENEIDRTTSLVQRQSYEVVFLGLKGLHNEGWKNDRESEGGLTTDPASVALPVNPNVVIPLIVDSTVLGFVVMRVPSPPEPWGNNWGILSAVYPFFVQAALSLQNMDVYARLRERDRLAALGEMSAGLAHEIRNPLGAIKGAAQLLMGDGSHQDQLLQVIVEEANRLNKVVSQFLDYSKPVGQEFVEYSVGVILQKALDLMVAMKGASGIEWRLETPQYDLDSLPKIRCHPEQVKQVLVNLLQNAALAIEKKISEASPPLLPEVDNSGPQILGTVLVGAVLQRNTRGGSEIVVYVEDSGSGIAKENLEKIFIPFFTTSPSGTGLGLSICARIMEAHGGRMEVASEEGAFTRFSLFFPLETQNNR